MSGLMTLNTAVTAATPIAMIASANAAKAGSRRIRRSAYRMWSRDELILPGSGKREAGSGRRATGDGRRATVQVRVREFDSRPAGKVRAESCADTQSDDDSSSPPLRRLS